MKIDVAVVDDEKDVQVYLQDVLGIGGQFNLTGCYGSGEEALAGIARIKPHVVLMDIRLPGMSGLTCARALKALYPDLKVIMLTAAVDEQHVVASMNAGADGFLPKPCTMTECWQAIRETVEQAVNLAAKGARLVVGELRRMGAPSDALGSLTPQEWRTLELVADGLADKEIGAVLGISASTVHTHVHHILQKVGVRSRTAAARTFHAHPIDAA